jgi:hypothetical protein
MGSCSSSGVRSVRFQIPVCRPSNQRKKPTNSAAFINVNIVPNFKYLRKRGLFGSTPATIDVV